MRKKLDELAKRHEEVNILIQDANLIKDQKKYREIMREHAHLEDLMEAYDKYKAVLSGIEEAKAIITQEDDHDMKEMAREELKSLEEKVPEMEDSLKMLLIPPDPLEEKILSWKSVAVQEETSPVFLPPTSLECIHDTAK